MRGQGKSLRNTSGSTLAPRGIKDEVDATADQCWEGLQDEVNEATLLWLGLWVPGQAVIGGHDVFVKGRGGHVH